jgi:hypothetical protein
MAEVSNLATRLITDADEGGRIAAIAGAATEQALRNFMAARLANSEAAAPRLRDWLLRVLRATTGITPDLRVGTPAQAVELVQTLLEQLGNSTQNIDAARIRPYVAELLQIVEVEFGISLPALEGMLWQIVDEIIDRLEAQPSETQRTARENRLDTIRMLRRIRRLVRGRFPLPVVDVDRIANGIAESLRAIDADRASRHLSCISQGVGALSDATRAIEDLVPIGITAFNSLGAAAAATSVGEKYCWYASWLYNTDVVINDTHTEIRKGDQVIATGVNLTVSDIPEFLPDATPRYTFKPLSVDEMEALAFGMYVAQDAVDAVLHLISLEKGDYFNNALNATYFASLSVAKGIRRKPLMRFGFESAVIPLSLSFIASFEGRHTNATRANRFKFWAGLLGADAMETVIYRYLSFVVRDAVLSLATLANYDGDFKSSTDPDPRPLNRKHIDGVVAIPGIFTYLWQFSDSMFPREKYATFGTGFVDHVVYRNMVIGSLFFVFARLSGCLLAMGVGRNFDGDAWVKSFAMCGVPALRFPFTWVTWFVPLYLLVENDTNKGKLNSGGAAFAGYPPFESSPYTLPYAKGRAVYVSQGNQGMYTHNHLTNQQTYAYDFCPDEGVEILASRPGTVVDYFDWIPDNTNPNATQQAAAQAEAQATGALAPGQTGDINSTSWNFILIRHDVDDAGTAQGPDAIHDKGPGGTQVTTYALYGHGRKDSVRELFLARTPPVQAANIIGSTVKRGHPIMRCGDTGDSTFNHLHMQVQADLPGAAAPRVVNPHDLQPETIPFVFKDVRNFIRLDGVPRALNFYESSVTVVP